MSAREEFEKQGKLYPCPNPSHPFRVGRLIGQWRWAKDCWSTLSESGTLHNHFLVIDSVDTVDGLKAYQLVIWKFSLMVGVAS